MGLTTSVQDALCGLGVNLGGGWGLRMGVLGFRGLGLGFRVLQNFVFNPKPSVLVS